VLAVEGHLATGQGPLDYLVIGIYVNCPWMWQKGDNTIEDYQLVA
jgi:hypothetical protein